jgi:hypothetical protein
MTGHVIWSRVLGYSKTACVCYDEFMTTQEEIMSRTWHAQEIKGDTSRGEACTTSFEMVWTYPREARTRGIWEESVKRHLKDWSITKELALDNRVEASNSCEKTWNYGSSFFYFFYSPCLWFSFLSPFPLFCLVFYCPSSFSLLFLSLFFASCGFHL